MKILNKISTGFFTIALSIATCACGNSEEPEPEPTPTPEPAIDATFTGTTVTAPVNAPDDIYTSTTGTYRFTIDENANTATLYIQNANFLQGMPQLGEMAFPNITYSITRDDANDNTSSITTISFTSDALTPEIADRPFPAFPITDLTATMHPGKSLEVNFVCTYRGTPYTVSFAGQPQP